MFDRFVCITWPGMPFPRFDHCRYAPSQHACWTSGSVPYEHVANTFAALDSTTKRLRIGDALTNMFRAVLAHSPGDLEATAYLTIGKIAPDYEGGELNIGGSIVSAAIAATTGEPLPLHWAAQHFRRLLVALKHQSIICLQAKSITAREHFAKGGRLCLTLLALAVQTRVLLYDLQTRFGPSR